MKIKKKEDKPIVLIDLTFKTIDECTKYFYNEYGKLNVVRKKLDDKKMLRDVRKFLNAQFRHAMNGIGKLNGQMYSKKNINETIKQTQQKAEKETSQMSEQLTQPKVEQIEQKTIIAVIEDAPKQKTD